MYGDGPPPPCAHCGRAPIPEGTLNVDSGVARESDCTTTRWSRQCPGVSADVLINKTSVSYGLNTGNEGGLRGEYAGLGMHVKRGDTARVDMPSLRSTVGATEVPELYFTVQATHSGMSIS